MKEENALGLFGNLILVSIVALLVLGLFTAITALKPKPVDAGEGIVLERVYSPGSSGATLAAGIDGSGGMVPTVVPYHQSETWRVIVDRNGEVLSADVSPSLWGRVTKGDTVKLRELRSISGETLQTLAGE